MIRNYSPKNGVVNGTRLIITEIHTHSVKPRILSGMEAHWGKEVLIGKVAITSNDTEHFGATLRRHQFPFPGCIRYDDNKESRFNIKEGWNTSGNAGL